MCLIALAWQARAGLALAVAANRDEWRDRPAEPAHWWPDHPALLAGRDLQAGGTWMGITRGGRFAAVTNFRDPSERRSTARSRGSLVTDFLAGTATPRQFMEDLGQRAAEYNGFNLIAGDGRSLWYYGSRENLAREVEPGVHGLSNHLLDEPWPKVVLARTRMQEAIAREDPVPAMFELLADRSPVPDEALPRTGVAVEWERRLALALITGPDYGTRASTTLTVADSGNLRFEERSLDADGRVTKATLITLP